jgi:hypothetical protein
MSYVDGFDNEVGYGVCGKTIINTSVLARAIFVR